MMMRIVGLVLVCAFASPVNAADRIIGAVSPEGGAVLVKHFSIPAGTTIHGITFVSNDLRTVFPKVALLRGPAAKISEAPTLLLATDVRTDESHRISVPWVPLYVAVVTDIYVAITLPPSTGVHGLRDGDGILATQLEAPRGSYFSAGPGAALGPMDVDYAIELVLEQQQGKANAGPMEAEQARPTTFLRVGSPKSASGSRPVQFGLEKAATADLAVYDVAGRRVRVLAHEWLGAGMHLRDWDGRDTLGHRVAAGIYLVRLTAAEKVLIQKLVMMK